MLGKPEHKICPVVPTCIITAVSIIGMLLCLLLKPSVSIKGHKVSTFYWPPALGLIALLCFRLLPFDEYWSGLTRDGAMNPLEILVLFFSMAFISTVLDEVGFFSYLANLTVAKAKNSQFALFFLLYFLCALLTMFTSNDIVIITFTPFILYFAKEAKIDPIPYLVCEFVAANTWSMIFIFGNPTNVYIASYFNLSFLSHLQVMWAPTLASGLIALGIMTLLFHKRLGKKLEVELVEASIKDKPVFVCALTLLLIVTVLMAASSLIGLPMWIFAGIGAACLLLLVYVKSIPSKDSKSLLLPSLKRLPFDLAPFLLSMFGLVMALSREGVSERFASLLMGMDPLWSYGLSSFALANLMNNLPMSVLYADLLGFAGMNSGAMFASIVSSNLGAILTPVGALAGILWMGILKDHGIKFSFFDFCLYGTAISLPSLAGSLWALSLIV